MSLLFLSLSFQATVATPLVIAEENLATNLVAVMSHQDSIYNLESKRQLQEEKGKDFKGQLRQP
ncbi:hypothetical protein POPTR_018G062450v4 [Populus trichocarpa]|uniref:Uncharacterized protein n=1 Tax=Populus trichocarpa TaxID=3694 RepID=A0ACC0RLW9_POPTR|nr:hypothetical protein BDE02_18G049200 [Populus trichocarpa]KAI9378234.1 hypothetical protein POPTR_018G062450v4 [Populus trichocarpa]